MVQKFHVEMDSFFENVDIIDGIETQELINRFNSSQNPYKINLFIGAYRTSDGQPYILPAVSKAKDRITENPSQNHEYRVVFGTEAFRQKSMALLLGEDSPAIKENRAHGIQTLSGTGALRLGAEFLFRTSNCKTVYISDPTWDNHRGIFKCAGFIDIRTYRYWNKNSHKVDIDGMLHDLSNAPRGAIIVLQACAHNPTGSDPSAAQWQLISDVIQRNGLFPFFDSAYQGFASGDLNQDAYSVRLFVSRQMELFCAQSFAKNLGLYGERIGNLTIVQKKSSTMDAVASQLGSIATNSYLTPPVFGAKIVETILCDPDLCADWNKSIQIMANRIKSMRRLLYTELVRLGKPGNWNHIVDQIGMFSYTGLTEQQSKFLEEEFNIFIRKSGRISISGLTEQNVSHVASAIHMAVTTVKN